MTELPPVAWPWWRRLGAGGFYGGCLAIFVLLNDLFRGKMGNGQYFNRLTGSAISLWPYVVETMLLFMMAGAFGGLLLPIYRYRRGGAMFGFLVMVLVATAMFAVDAALHGAGSPPGSIGGWQEMLIWLIMGGFFAYAGESATRLVLGTEHDPQAAAPPP